MSKTSKAKANWRLKAELEASFVPRAPDNEVKKAQLRQYEAQTDLLKSRVAHLLERSPRYSYKKKFSTSTADGERHVQARRTLPGIRIHFSKIDNALHPIVSDDTPEARARTGEVMDTKTTVQQPSTAGDMTTPRHLPSQGPESGHRNTAIFGFSQTMGAGESSVGTAAERMNRTCNFKMFNRPKRSLAGQLLVHHGTDEGLGGKPVTVCEDITPSQTTRRRPHLVFATPSLPTPAYRDFKARSKSIANGRLRKDGLPARDQLLKDSLCVVKASDMEDGAPSSMRSTWIRTEKGMKEAPVPAQIHLNKPTQSSGKGLQMEMDDKKLDYQLRQTSLVPMAIQMNTVTSPISPLVPSEGHTSSGVGMAGITSSPNRPLGSKSYSIEYRAAINMMGNLSGTGWVATPMGPNAVSGGRRTGQPETINTEPDGQDLKSNAQISKEEAIQRLKRSKVMEFFHRQQGDDKKRTQDLPFKHFHVTTSGHENWIMGRKRQAHSHLRYTSPSPVGALGFGASKGLLNPINPDSIIRLRNDSRLQTNQLLSPSARHGVSVSSQLRGKRHHRKGGTIRLQVKNFYETGTEGGRLDFEPVLEERRSGHRSIAANEPPCDTEECSESAEALHYPRSSVPEWQGHFESEMQAAMLGCSKTKAKNSKFSAATMEQVVQALKLIDERIKMKEKQYQCGRANCDSDAYGSEGLSDSDDEASDVKAEKKKLRQRQRATAIRNAKFVPGLKRLSKEQQARKKKFRALKDDTKALEDLTRQLAGTIEAADVFENEDSLTWLEFLIAADPSFKQQMQSAHPITKQLFNDLLGLNQRKSEKLQAIREAKEKILAKTKEMLRLQLASKLAAQLSAGAVQYAVDRKEGHQGNGKRQGYSKLKTKRGAAKRRLKELIEKHVMAKYRRKLDLPTLVAVVKLQHHLLTFLEGGQLDNVGQRYQDIVKNLWQNTVVLELQTSLEQQLKQEQIPSEQLHMLTTTIEQLAPALARKRAASLEDLGNLMKPHANKMTFYEQIRERHAPATPGAVDDDNQEQYQLNTEERDEKVARQKFFQKCFDHREVPMPTFVKIQNRCLFLADFGITDQMAEALYDFLAAAKESQAQQVRRLVIDDCGMTDTQFSWILKGIAEQQAYSQIEGIVYSGELGQSSQALLTQLVDGLRELQLTNISRGGFKLHIDQLLGRVHVRSLVIQKLKLSNINLLDDSIQDRLVQLLLTKRTLWQLELSWCKLGPKQLVMLAKALVDVPNQLKILNLAYNSLVFEERQLEKYQASMEFLNLMLQYLQTSKMLYHINLSGLGFKMEQLTSLCEVMSVTESLQAIHLNDNLIMQNKKKANKLLRIFGIDLRYDAESDSFKDPDSLLFDQAFPTLKENQMHALVKQAYKNVRSEQILDHDKEVDATTYKDHYLLANKARALKSDKLKNQIQSVMGINEVHTSNLDHFVLTRVVNHPELIFNQDRLRDCFFDKDASARWQLSDKNSCYLCQRHKYVAICYSQDAKAENGDLREVKDEATVCRIREWMNFNIINQDTTTPVISGTVLNGGFSRKLRMLRQDIYALLCVANSQDLVADRRQQKAIKEGLVALAASDQNFRYHDVTACMAGYQSVLLDKWYKNEVTDIQLINEPPDAKHWDLTEARRRAKASSSMSAPRTEFVFAAYVPPGIHHFLIYCPATHRAFVKEVLVRLDTSDFAFPELPIRIQPPPGPNGAILANRIYSDVWSGFRHDTPSLLAACCVRDLADAPGQPLPGLEDPSSRDKCAEILARRYAPITYAFKYMLARSQDQRGFPEVPNLVFFDFYRDILVPTMENWPEAERLALGNFEVQYVATTRADGQTGLRGTLCRGEFTTLLLRLCGTWVGKEKRIEDHLETFLDKLLEGFYQGNAIDAARETIQGDPRVNQLLDLNQRGLDRIRKDFKEVRTSMAHGRMVVNLYKPRFTLRSARTMLSVLNLGLSRDNELELDNIFMYSKQTLVDERNYNKKYFYLTKVEFQEYLVRVALYLNQMQNADMPEDAAPMQEQKLEEVLYNFLSTLWERFKKARPSVTVPELLELEPED